MLRDFRPNVHRIVTHKEACLPYIRAAFQEVDDAVDGLLHAEEGNGDIWVVVVHCSQEDLPRQVVVD